LRRSDAQACDLRDALARDWRTDAHLTAYEPRAIDIANGAPMVVRLTKGMVGDPAIGDITMVALIGDVDPPEHEPTKAWRREIRAKLRDSGLAWYETRRGARVVAELARPFAIRTPADEAAWTARYLAWVASVAADHGVALDESCADWTRLYRLPNVIRDGAPSRSLVSRLDEIPRLRLPKARAGAPSKPARKRDRAPSDAFDRARAIALRMPASIEGMGGDEALFQAAREIATQLGGDADAIEAVLTDDFNPRCQPAWPASKLAREAARAADAQTEPEARLLRRHAARQAERDTRPALAIGDPWNTFQSFTAPDEPIPYLIEGLRLAPSLGKISLVAGNAGGAKGPLVDYLSVCLALGVDVWGMSVTRTRVLLIDKEGWRLTMRRLRRMARGLGLDPRELEGWILLKDATLIGDLSRVDNLQAIERVVDERDCGAVAIDSYTTAMLESGVDANTPQFATLAQQLGKLDRLVLAVAHSNKASAANGQPKLYDVAGSGALGALSQTALMLHYPDDEDHYTVRISCGRAPETPFAPIDVRFADADDGSLLVTRVVADATEPAPEMLRMRSHLADVHQAADRVAALLGELDPLGVGMPAVKIRSHLSMPGKLWGEAREELLRRGRMTEATLPSSRNVVCKLIRSNER
jgi:hypothetical protein